MEKEIISHSFFISLYISLYLGCAIYNFYFFLILQKILCHHFHVKIQQWEKKM